MNLLVVDSLAATIALGRSLATCAATIMPPPPHVLMRGELGAGKTTFIRAVVEALPGAELADISSPSFNIVNLYPTTPKVAHFDLYRTAGQGLDADLEDIFFDVQHWCLMEWAEYLPVQNIPQTYLAMDWTVRGDARAIRLHAVGATAQTLLQCLLATFIPAQDNQ